MEKRKRPSSSPPDSLPSLLDSLFEKKMAPLEGRVSGTVRDLRAAKERFYEACIEFEKLDAPPYTEDLWMPNINSIKNQKEQYASALKQIAASLNLEVDDTLDRYSRYRQVLSNVEAMTNDALKTNSKFKQAFYCYSNYMGNFKKASAYLERLTTALKNELDRRAAEFEQYGILKECILKLRLQGEELASLRDAIGALKSNLKSSDDGGLERIEAETKGKLSAKSAEISALSDEMSKLSNRIGLLTAPLERAARKLDHLTIRKKPLYDYITDPIGRIRNDDEYKDFTDLVLELRKNVESGTIDAKNKQELQNSISALLNSEIHHMINSLKALEHKKADILAEERELQRVMEGIEFGRESKAKSHHQMEKMEKDILEISKSRESLKSGIEKGFYDNYAKHVSILL